MLWDCCKEDDPAGFPPICRINPFFLYMPASSSSPRFTSDLEQARPQTTGEEELQLQLALAMSREEAEKVMCFVFLPSFFKL